MARPRPPCPIAKRPCVCSRIWRPCTTTWENALRAIERYVDAPAKPISKRNALDSNLAMAHAHLGLTLGKEGQTDNALQWLKRATDLKPKNATFWEYLAEAHGIGLESSPSHSLLAAQLEFGEEREGPHLSLGWALQEEGHVDEAIEHYHAAARLNPEGGMPPMSLAGVYEEQGKLAEAEAALRQRLFACSRSWPAACPAGHAAAWKIERRRSGRSRNASPMKASATGRGPHAFRPSTRAQRAERLRPGRRVSAEGQCADAGAKP